MIDLHTHTRASDGTDSPADLIGFAVDSGLTHVGLTDHDTVSGWAEAEAAATRVGIGLVRGVEMSARYLDHSIHVLGYLLDPSQPAFTNHTAFLRQSRTDRLATMVAKLEADGLVSAADVAAHTPDGATPGRPHIADALVAAGHYSERGGAFDGVLSTTSPYYVPYEAPGLDRVIATIHDCGGVAVWAHPMARTRWVPTEKEIEAAVEMGLDGLEVDHRDNADRDLLGRIVAKAGLIRTGSSDYHGGGKPNRLGENLTAPDQLEEILRRGALEVIGV